MFSLSDRLIMEQSLKFQLNGGKDDKNIFENAFKEKKGILYFSSKLNLEEVEKIKYALEKKYINYQFCYMQKLNCVEIGFSTEETK